MDRVGRAQHIVPHDALREKRLRLPDHQLRFHHRPHVGRGQRGPQRPLVTPHQRRVALRSLFRQQFRIQPVLFPVGRDHPRADRGRASYHGDQTTCT